MNTAADDDLQSAEERAVIARTRQWIERAVIGLNLCPFARAPYVSQRVRYEVSKAVDTEVLLDELCGELQSLKAADPAECETTLLIVPHVLADFLDFNDFLDEIDAAIEVLGLDGEIQVASFHPDYQFAGTDTGDIENFTNRSPLPIFHLLRESSIEKAVDAMADSEEIYRRNMATLRKLGSSGWAELWRDPDESA
jgi:hypothetical protein